MTDLQSPSNPQRLIPSFRQPDPTPSPLPPESLPPWTGPSPSQSQSEGPGSWSDDGPDAPSDASKAPGTRTGGSSRVSKPTIDETTELLIGALGLVVAAAAFALRQWARRELRKPTAAQEDRIGRPLARIALRHVPAHLLNADLMDVLAAGGAVGVYLNDGPLTEPMHVDPGQLPNQDQEA